MGGVHPVLAGRAVVRARGAVSGSAQASRTAARTFRRRDARTPGGYAPGRAETASVRSDRSSGTAHPSRRCARQPPPPARRPRRRMCWSPPIVPGDLAAWPDRRPVAGKGVHGAEPPAAAGARRPPAARGPSPASSTCSTAPRRVASRQRPGAPAVARSSSANGAEYAPARETKSRSVTPSGGRAAPALLIPWSYVGRSAIGCVPVPKWPEPATRKHRPVGSVRPRVGRG